MVYNAGELSLVEYGRNEVLGSCRTEHMSRFLVSLRLCGGGSSGVSESRRLAFLIDLQTARVLDLAARTPLATVNHDAKIDWLVCVSRKSPLTWNFGVSIVRRELGLDMLHEFDAGSDVNFGLQRVTTISSKHQFHQAHCRFDLYCSYSTSFMYLQSQHQKIGQSF